MHIRLLTVKFHLEGCQSLKEKRHRLAGAKKRLGKESFIAVMESGYQDLQQTAEWCIVIMGDSAAQVAQRAAFAEQSLMEGLDARVLEIAKERLY